MGLNETRRLLWLLALLFTFITVTFFQYIELPKGTFLLTIFSIGKSQLLEKNSTALLSTNTTSLPVGLKVNSSVSEEVGASDSFVELDENRYPLDVPSLDDVKEQLDDYKDHSLSNKTIGDFALVPRANTGNFSMSATSPISQPPTISSTPDLSNTSKEDFTLALGVNIGNFNSSHVSPISQPPTVLVSTTHNNGAPVSSSSLSLTDPVMSVKLNTSVTSNGTLSSSPPSPVPVGKGRPQISVRDVYTLADMDQFLIESRWATHSTIPRWSSKADKELINAKSEIENAVPSSKDLELYGPIYRNLTIFRRSYELMEQILKVYVYKEGERPVFHEPPLDGIYASEGWFMKLMESNKHFVTRDPRRAHLFYLPFSSKNLVSTLYVPNSHSHKNLVQYLEKYLNTIIGKYSFWNRTGGADHFLVACHDWAPFETRRIMSTCIRAMCNANAYIKEGFKFGKDASLPTTNIPNARNPLQDLGGKSPRRRRTLVFFAGQMHGYLRPILLKHWENVDPDMKIFGQLPRVKGNRNYIGYMQSSKYCICARGYQVHTPRVVEAIFYECVPVIISDNYVPPFFETLNWESFAVFVAEKDIPNLKNILKSIPQKKYLQLYMRVKKVQQHFLWHPNPVKYDLFHMILHSIWYNRLFQFKPRTHSL